MTVWKDAVNYEGLYEVNNKGSVRSKEGKTTVTKMHGVRTWKSRVLKEKNKGGRDVRFDLWKDGKPETFLAHRLVAKAFIPNPERKRTINHIDGNPRNNSVDNLEWATHKENQNHSVENGLANSNINIFLTDKKTGKIKEFRSMSKASEYLGRNKGYLSWLINDSVKGKLDGYEIKIDDRRF